MSVRRYWINPTKIADEAAVIDEQLFRHICLVCKHTEGDEVELLPGDGWAYLAKIVNLKKKAALCSIVSKRKIEPLPRPHIHLCVSLPKFNKLEFIIEKSVELGVASLRLFTSDYSFVKSASRISESKISRWKGIVSSASQQSGRGELMALPPVLGLKDLVAETQDRDDIFSFVAYEKLSESGEALSLKSHLEASLSDEKVSSLDSIMIFVGSEGGFSEKEAELFIKSGVMPVSLGSQILRVETACLALISSIKYQLST